MSLTNRIPVFSRSTIGGKKSAEVKARITDEAKFDLQRRCAELGMTESEYVERLLCVSLYGFDAVLEAEIEKTRKVVGMWGADKLPRR